MARNSQPERFWRKNATPIVVARVNLSKLLSLALCSPPVEHGCAHAMRPASSYETGDVLGRLYAAGGDADGRTKLLVIVAA